MLGIGRLARLWGRRGSLESFATTARHAGDPTVRGDEGRRHFRITRRRRSRKLYKFALAAVCRIVRLAAEIDVRPRRASYEQAARLASGATWLHVSADLFLPLGENYPEFPGSCDQSFTGEEEEGSGKLPEAVSLLETEELAVLRE